MDQQRLMAGGVTWRRNQSDASIAEYIGVTVDKPKLLRRAQQFARQRHQLINVVVRPVRRMYPAVLSFLHHDCGVGEQPHIPYMVSMRVRYCNSTDVAGLQSDFRELICY